MGKDKRGKTVAAKYKMQTKLTLYNLMWVFLAASFLGVISETILIFITHGRLERTSGVLYGPFNQVYGVGAVMFTVILYRFNKRKSYSVFIAGMMFGMVFEYVCSFLQQVLLGSKCWDYSTMPGNIAGRTNIIYGLGWGFMGVLFITKFWPWLSYLVGKIPKKIGKPLIMVTSGLLVLNIIFSGIVLLRTSQRLAGIAAQDPVSQWIDVNYPVSFVKARYPALSFEEMDKGINR